VRILDGNCFAGTEHRLKVLRPYAAKPLPGKSLVVRDPAQQLVTDIFPCTAPYGRAIALLSLKYLCWCAVRTLRESDRPTNNPSATVETFN